MLDPHLVRAELLYDQGRFELARDELRQVLAGDPEDLMGHAWMALCQLELEEYADAAAEAEQAVHLAPDEPFVHYVMARVALARNRFKEAFTAIDQAIGLDPYIADFHSLKAVAQFNQSAWTEALGCAEKALELDAENVQASNLRAMALVKLGRREEAGLTLDHALARNPENSVSHSSYGWAHMESSKPREALEHFREALRLDPENEAARAGIVEALKARNPVYRWCLRYFLAMARLPARFQLGIVIGAVILMRLLGGLEERDPSWQPWVLPVQIAYLGFVLMTWTAIPFFNLLLRLDRDGRTALTEEQTREANMIGGLVLLIVACVVTSVFLEGPFLFGALIFMLLIFPTASMFRCAAGWPRRVMQVAAGILCLLATGAIFCLYASHLLEEGAERPWDHLGGWLMNQFVFWAIMSSWGGALLAAVRVKK